MPCGASDADDPAGRIARSSVSSRCPTFPNAMARRRESKLRTSVSSRSRRPFRSSIREFTAPIWADICADSNPPTTRMAGPMVPMTHFVSLLMPLSLAPH